jgi:7-cyano-7-deazaguanine synthase
MQTPTPVRSLALSHLGPRQPGRRAMLLMSGGQDSFVAALLAKEWCDEVHAVHFRYGQQHAIEESCASKLAREIGLSSYDVFDLGLLATIGDSALVRKGQDLSGQHPRAAHLPASFVPGRNLLFLTAAAALAFKLGCGEIWTGICQSDFTNYPDCREDFLTSTQGTLHQAFDQANPATAMRLVAPLLKLNKAEIFLLAAERGRLDLLIESTHSCYRGDRLQRLEWGYGCGLCWACTHRLNGYLDFKDIDAERGVMQFAARLTEQGYTAKEAAHCVLRRCRYLESRWQGGAA